MLNTNLILRSWPLLSFKARHDEKSPNGYLGDTEQCKCREPDALHHNLPCMAWHAVSIWRLHGPRSLAENTAASVSADVQAL